jgi:subtilisin-like proprotein convertase family protein
VETFPKGSGKDTIKITDNITIEFVEVTLTTYHHLRGDLTVVLFSPHGTHSVLGEPHPTMSGVERYNDWRF